MALLKKNDIYEVEIKGVTSEGNGVGNIEGFVVFVPGTVTGDRVLVQLLKVNKNYAYAKVKEIVTPSCYRKIPPCEAFGKCGGCSLMHIDYNYQLKIKKEIIENAMSRIGKVEKGVEEMLGADSPQRYRNKMIFPVGKDVENKPVCGFFRQRSHDIIPLEDCLLGHEFNAEVIAKLKEYMTRHNVSAYDEKTHTGIIRRVFTRYGRKSGEIMIVISANARELPKKDDLIAGFRSISEKVVSIILNVQREKTNLVLGNENIVLFGKGEINDTLCGINYEISPHSFYQINPDQTERLYKKALEYADIKGTDTVLDIYCGIGTISLSAAKSAKRVVGVEIVPEAIENAKENAKNNGISNAEFYCADAAEIVPKLINEGKIPDVVILDPPRKGSDEKTLEALAKAKPQRIVYVSCNPATLARDVRFLEDMGYITDRICGVDMFPNSNHVETVCKLSKRIGE